MCILHGLSIYQVCFSALDLVCLCTNFYRLYTLYFNFYLWPFITFFGWKYFVSRRLGFLCINTINILCHFTNLMLVLFSFLSYEPGHFGSPLHTRKLKLAYH